jgi:sirohydrochlorin ferrochelatase
MPTTQSENNSDWGTLLVGHGTRDATGRAEFLTTAASVAELLPHMAVEPCFLELAAPDIAAAVERLLKRRVTGICVMPLMLFAANHVKRDTPAAVADAVDKFGGLPTTQAPHLGCHERLLELSVRRYQESLAGRQREAVENTLLIMVGGGSRDPEAIEEMRRFVRLRCEITRVGGRETCFAALAEPSLAQTLAKAAHGPYRHVVVQPHLLFEGRLLARVRDQVALTAANSPKTWTVASHLGVSPLLAEAVVRIVANRLAGPTEELT